MSLHSAHAQSLPLIDEMSYLQRESRELILPNGMNIEDLHPFDNAYLNELELTYSVENYVDESGNPQTIKTIIDGIELRQNESLAVRWIHNQNGTQVFSSQKVGVNEMYYLIETLDHSELQFNNYQNKKKEILKDGFLASKIFPKMAKEILDKGKPSGNFGNTNTAYVKDKYGNIVINNRRGEYIVFGFDSIQNIRRGIIKYIKYEGAFRNEYFPNIPNEEDEDVMEVSISDYSIELSGDWILSKTVDLKKIVLSDGTYAHRKIVNEYSDYTFHPQKKLYTANESSNRKRVEVVN